MKFRTLLQIFLATIFALGLTNAASAQGQLTPYEKQKYERNRSAVSIISGGINGTYIRYATDLANVLDDLKGNEMRVLPLIGRGGGQNVIDILFLKGIDMGLTQQDHLSFFKNLNPRLYGDIDKRIRFITKLYNSEYHLIASKNIKKFEDLRGKTVNFWKPWSATDIGSKTIFRLLDIDVKPNYISTAKGLEQIKSGEIAATVLLAGAPVTGFAKIKAEDGLHIVPLGQETLTKEQHAKLLKVFLQTKLTSKQYPKIIPEGQVVPSFASGVVLAVYNWQEGSKRYKKVARFVDKFFSNFEKLQKPPRHPKWKEVNLAAKIPGWTRFKAAEEWLQNAKPGPTKRNQAFVAFLKDSGRGNISPQEKKVLFGKFSEWWITQRR
ncbi:MAG: TAXI family TRAP transporter solute-binding subunit [Alphaproteobacteria bacterium]